jgi:uncharacterized iron-regulated membrane protein
LRHSASEEAIMRESVKAAPGASIYNAVWRWHFIAGMLALPFLLNLAVTGALYLFHPEINSVLYHSLETVPARSTPALATNVLIEKAERETGGKVSQVTLPAEPTTSLALAIRIPSGERRTAYLDPYDGTLLGTIAQGGVMAVVKKLHSLEFFGIFANCLIEIAAGWVVILVLSGIYLWWPRGRKAGVVTIRANPKSRFFWRDLHAVTGIFAGVVILFLAVTGMPWSPIWGKTVQQWTTAAGLGRPAPPVQVTMRGQSGGAARPAQGHDAHEANAPANLPWALEQIVPPQSRPQGANTASIVVDRAVTILANQGLERPFSVALPVGPEGAYVGTFKSHKVEEGRTLYVDQFSGKILGDVSYKDFGPAARLIEWGISVHQGEQFGTINRYVMLAGCVAIVLLVVSAPIMWWKRRPRARSPCRPRRGIGALPSASWPSWRSAESCSLWSALRSCSHSPSRVSSGRRDVRRGRTGSRAFRDSKNPMASACRLQPNSAGDGRLTRADSIDAGTSWDYGIGGTPALRHRGPCLSHRALSHKEARRTMRPRSGRCLSQGGDHRRSGVAPNPTKFPETAELSLWA